MGRTAAPAPIETGGPMATIDECRTALEQFAENLASNPKTVRKLQGFQRSLAADITDLSVSFNGKFDQGKLTGITDGDNPDAEIRMIVSSDNLLKLVAGELDFMKAFTGGQVKLKANMMDLMKLRGVL
jgi:putative sterol carrier protein